MPDLPPPTPPPKRVRLIPWRGPLHWLLLVGTSGAALMLLLLYGGLLAGLGGFLVWMAFDWVVHVARTGQWQELRSIPAFLAGVVTWIFMLRPVLPKPSRAEVALQATPGSQPRLFEMVREICWHLRVAPPVEIWLDTTTRIRSGLREGLWKSGPEEMVLRIGLPVVAVMSARELAALLVRELAGGGGGLGATFSHAVRELDGWFYRALHEREPWQQPVRKRPRKEKLVRRIGRSIAELWMGVAKVPFVLFFGVAKVITAPALWRLRRGAEQAAIHMAGTQAWRRVEQRMTLLDAAWEEACLEIKRGLAQHRLPENLALLVARHVTQAARQQDPAVESKETPPAATPRGSGVLPHLPVDVPAASQLRGFVDLSRQVSYCYYQQELGISLNEHRLVAEEEVLHQNRRDNTSLAVIRRYFSGLAHPERAMCGQGARDAGGAGPDQLVEEIRRVREEMAQWGSHLKSALHEWNIAWQRRRDLEAAATLSLAGFSISRIQFGTDDTSSGFLHQEATRQRMQMEQMEGLLQSYEAKMESRFAAALGLLWWAEPGQLDACLTQRRAELSGWVAMYEAMAGALPAFRELLTTFFAFQTLGARFACLDDAGSFFTALQSVVPKMTNLVRQILATMDGAVYCADPGGATMPLKAYLLQGELPETESLTTRLPKGANVKALSSKVASEASEVIAPFVDRFLKLYHDTYAWLAESAEATEISFLGVLSRGEEAEAKVAEEVIG